MEAIPIKKEGPEQTKPDLRIIGAEGDDPAFVDTFGEEKAEPEKKEDFSIFTMYSKEEIPERLKMFGVDYAKEVLQLAIEKNKEELERNSGSKDLFDIEAIQKAVNELESQTKDEPKQELKPENEINPPEPEKTEIPKPEEAEKAAGEPEALEEKSTKELLAEKRQALEDEMVGLRHDYATGLYRVDKASKGQEKLTGFRSLFGIGKKSADQIDRDKAAAESVLAENRAKMKEALKNYRQVLLEEKEMEIDRLISENKLKPEAKEAALEKAAKEVISQIYLESGKICMVKDDIVVEQMTGPRRWINEKTTQIAESYEKLDWKKKVAVSGALFAGGVAGGLLAGPIGTAMVSAAFAGQLSTRVVGGTMATVGTERLFRAGQQKLAERKFTKELCDKFYEKLKAEDIDLEEKIFELVKNYGDKKSARMMLAGVAGAFVGTGAFATAIRNSLDYLPSGMKDSLVSYWQSAQETIFGQHNVEGAVHIAGPTEAGKISAAAVKEGAASIAGVETASTIVPEAAPKIPVINNIETAKAGDSVWKMSERQLAAHYGDKFTGLENAKKIYLIDAIKDKIAADPGSFNLSDPDKIKIGQQVNFEKIFAQTSEINNAFAQADKLTPEQLHNILNYKPPVQAPENLPVGASGQEITHAPAPEPVGPENAVQGGVENKMQGALKEYLKANSVSPDLYKFEVDEFLQLFPKDVTDNLSNELSRHWHNNSVMIMESKLSHGGWMTYSEFENAANMAKILRDGGAENFGSSTIEDVLHSNQPAEVAAGPAVPGVIPPEQQEIQKAILERENPAGADVSPVGPPEKPEAAKGFAGAVEVPETKSAPEAPAPEKSVKSVKVEEYNTKNIDTEKVHKRLNRIRTENLNAADLSLREKTAYDIFSSRNPVSSLRAAIENRGSKFEFRSIIGQYERITGETLSVSDAAKLRFEYDNLVNNNYPDNSTMKKAAEKDLLNFFNKARVAMNLKPIKNL